MAGTGRDHSDRLRLVHWVSLLRSGLSLLGSALQFNNMKRHFSGKYGPPKTKHNSAGQRTILRWKTENVNIKLKMKSTGQDIKMAVYYVPLAGKINQAQVDDIPPELYRKPAGEAKQAGGPAPLLD